MRDVGEFIRDQAIRAAQNDAVELVRECKNLWALELVNRTLREERDGRFSDELADKSRTIPEVTNGERF